MKMQKEKINPMKGWKGALCSMILAISSFSSLNTASANHCEGQCGPRTDTVFPFLSPTLWFHLHLINSDHKYAALFCETRNQVQFSSVTQSCPTLCNPRNSSTLGLPVHHQLPESLQTHVHWVGDAIQPSHPLSSLFFLASIFPSIRVFPNESALRIRWPKYWSLTIDISPTNERPGLISFKMDWLDLLAVQGTLKSLL